MSGQVNMADEAKLHSPIHSTFEALVVRCVVGCCHGEEFGPFCWPVPATGVAVFWIPAKPLHLRSRLSKLMRYTENCNTCSWHWSAERAKFSMTTPDHISHNRCFKSWVTKFYLICHIHLTSRQLTTTSSNILTTSCRESISTTSRMQKMLSKSSLNPEAWIFMLQE